MEKNDPPDSFFLKTHLTVQAAAKVSGYNAQYLRRLLRAGKLKGDKIGQMWLVDKVALDSYIEKARDSTDQRFGSN